MRTNGERRQINAFGSEIFREITILDIKAFGPDFLNAFFGQKADLPDAVFCMSIIFETQVFQKQAAINVILFSPFF